MADGGNVTYHFKADDKEVLSKLKNVGKVAAGVGAGLGAAFTAGTAVAIKGITSLTKKSFDAFTEFEQLEGGVYAMTENNAELYSRIFDNAANAYKNLTMSENEYLKSFEGSYAIIKNGLSKNADAIDYTNKMIQISSDLYNTYGGSVEQYQNAINWAFKGTYSYLDNLNIGIKGTKEGFVEAANESGVLEKKIKNVSELTNDQILDVIQHYTEAAGAFGRTEEEAADTIQGSLNQVKATWENFVSGLASDGDMKDLLKKLVKAIQQFAKNVFPIIENILRAMLDILPDVLNDIVTKLPGAIQKLLPPLLTALTKLLQGVVKAIPLLLKTLVNALPMVINSLITMMLDVVNALIDILPSMIPMLVQAIIDGYLQILDHFDEIFNAGIQLIVALADGIIDSLPILIEKMPMIILQLKMNLIKAAPKLIAAAFQIIWHLIKGIVRYTPQLVAKMPGIITQMVNKLKERVNEFFDYGKNILQGMWNGIKSKKEWLIDRIEGIGRSIKDAIKKVLGISSPSKEFAIIGRFSMMGFDEGLQDMQPEIQKTIDSIFTLSPSMVGGMNTYSPNVNVVVNNNMELDPLGQVVSNIKTFSGGAKNDYNYGQGV